MKFAVGEANGSAAAGPAIRLLVAGGVSWLLTVADLAWFAKWWPGFNTRPDDNGLRITLSIKIR